MGQQSLTLALYLDTNVLISLHEGDDEAHEALWSLVNAGIGRDDVTFHTSALAFSELLAKPYRMRDRRLARQYLSLAQSQSWLSVRDMDARAIELAAVIRATLRLKLPDAIHLATAVCSNCTHLLTSDAGFFDLGDIEHPISGTPISVGVVPIRPDLSSISDLLRALQ